MTRPWRTNVGLRLSAELGAWVDEHCRRENRTMANYIETLILRDRGRLEGEDQQTVETWFDRFDRLRSAGRYAEAHAMLCAPAPANASPPSLSAAAETWPPAPDTWAKDERGTSDRG